MALRKPECLSMIDTSEVVELREGDLPALRCLYDVAYPGNWFYPRMLRTGLYRGIWRGDRLVSVAGIHTYSPEYGVAALGNITTLPEYRGQGLAAAVTAALCQSLIQRDTLVGLNVKADNLRAIATYARLGFAITDTYEECGLNAKGVADYVRATSDD